MTEAIQKKKALENFLLELEKRKDYEVIKNRFPHIAQRMDGLWGKQELHTYLNQLITSNKKTNRAGFPIEIMQALYHVMNLHDDFFPQMEKRFTSNSDIWDLALFGK